jgi:hypothetical protein
MAAVIMSLTRPASLGGTKLLFGPFALGAGSVHGMSAHGTSHRFTALHKKTAVEG